MSNRPEEHRAYIRFLLVMTMLSFIIANQWRDDRPSVCAIHFGLGAVFLALALVACIRDKVTP